MRQLLKQTMFLGLLALAPLLGFAAVPAWQIVPAESNLSFTGTQNDAPVTGEFKTFSGELLIDPDDLPHSSIHIVVDMNSLNASYAEVKSTLITPEWFDIKLFPKADFKSDKIIKTGDKSYEAKGMLTIRDKSAPIILNLNVEELSATKGVVTGNSLVKRTVFGVGQGEWAGTDEIKDDVTVNFRIVATKK